MEDFEEIAGIIMITIIVIGTCVVLPLLIVWMNNKRKRHEIDKKSEILMTLMEKNPELDPTEVTNKLNMSQKSENKTLKQTLLEKLFTGCICLLIGAVILCTHLMNVIFLGDKALGIVGGGVLAAVGIAHIVYYFVAKKVMCSEIEAEERRLKEQ